MRQLVLSEDLTRVSWPLEAYARTDNLADRTLEVL